MKRLALFTVLLFAGVAKPPAAMSITPVAFPYGGHSTVNPYVASEDNGFDVSWVDGRTLEFAHFDGVKWSRWNRIAHGEMLQNRADYPSIAVSGRNVIAQWREKFGKGRRIRLSRSNDGGETWSKPVTPHPMMDREFGFVSMLPLADGTARIAWLDGRDKETELRAATMTTSGTLGDEAVVDSRVCDCCQTAMAMTPRGPLVVYRDRSANEIRDVAIAAPVANARNALVHNDGWRLAGCPVNGPRIVANGVQAVVAWYTAANYKRAVLVAFSHNGGATFGAPIRVDAGHADGRVDVVLLADDSALATWVENGSQIVARRVAKTGILDPIQIVATSKASIGFPRIALSNGNVLAAWNGDDGVHLAIIKPRIR